MESAKLNEQARGNSAFDWLPESAAVCRLGSDRYPYIFLKSEDSRKTFQKRYSGEENFFLKKNEDRVGKPFKDRNSFKRNKKLFIFDNINQKTIFKHNLLV